MICYLLLVLLLIIGILLGWLRFGITASITRRYLLFMMIIAIGYSLIYWCSWDSIEYYFNTQEPFYNQLFRLLGSTILILLYTVAASAGFIVASLQVKRSSMIASNGKLIAMAVSLGACIAGIFALLRAYQPSRTPYWGHYGYLACSRPWTAAWLSTTFQFALLAAGAIVLLNLFYEIEKVRWGKILLITCIPLVAIIAIGSQELTTIPYWIILGLVLGLCALVFYYLLLRYCVAAVPILVAVLTIAGAIEQGIQGLFPLALGIMIFTSIVVAQLAWGWFYTQSEQS